MTADITIRNARILDGTGAPAFGGDIAITGDRITRVGAAGPATREIDARGLTLSPGFVDTHSHDDGAFLRYPGMEFKVAQGVTSEVSGNCGFSSIPNEPGRKYMPGDIATGGQTNWTDLESYFAACMAAKPAINNIMLVGHNRLRASAVGLDKRAATADELAEMRGEVAKAMEQGACGFSTGLIYEPGRYSDTDEVVALAAECRPFEGIYATHMRNEGDKLLDAVEEALTIAKGAGIGLHISHHKSAGKRNWGRIGQSFARVDRAEAEGQKVTFDVYPYTAGSGPMWQYVNLDHIDPEWSANVMINSCPDDPTLEGKMMPEIAAERGWELTEAVRNVLTSPRGKQVVCTHFIIDEADIETNLRDPRVMIGSDGIPDLKGRPHPRLYGTMPRVLAKYVRERGVLSLEEAVRRMTSLACDRFGLAGRGRIQEGAFADLVLFDPATVQDTATYPDPKQEPVGIDLVVVNGQVAVEKGKHTGAGSGRMLRYRRE
ncbi:D-aminoacylase [bacterium]|nr:D-aminoacylase [bacterium]